MENNKKDSNTSVDKGFIQKHTGIIFDILMMLAILFVAPAILQRDETLDTKHAVFLIIGFGLAILAFCIAAFVQDFKDQESLFKSILKNSQTVTEENEVPNVNVVLKDGNVISTYVKYPTSFVDKAFNHPYKTKYIAIYPCLDENKNKQVVYIPIENIMYIKKFESERCDEYDIK